jgi:hypothetical protein
MSVLSDIGALISSVINRILTTTKTNKRDIYPGRKVYTGREFSRPKEYYGPRVKRQPPIDTSLKCLTCEVQLHGLDSFYCKVCEHSYCEKHRLHSRLHQGDEREVTKEALDDFGSCDNCKRRFNNAFSSTVCIRCTKKLCYDCVSGPHDCKKFNWAGGSRRKIPKLDLTLTKEDIKLISLARQKLLELCNLSYEVSGFIDQSGDIVRQSTGNSKQVEHAYVSGDQIECGIFFHTHPNEIAEPSSQDIKVARMFHERGNAVKCIVVCAQGFSSYGAKQPYGIFYGWDEIG